MKHNITSKIETHFFQEYFWVTGMTLEKWSEQDNTEVTARYVCQREESKRYKKSGRKGPVALMDLPFIDHSKINMPQTGQEHFVPS